MEQLTTDIIRTQVPAGYPSPNQSGTVTQQDAISTSAALEADQHGVPILPTGLQSSTDPSPMDLPRTAGLPTSSVSGESEECSGLYRSFSTTEGLGEEEPVSSAAEALPSVSIGRMPS